MFLRRIVIENVRSIEHLDLSFDQGEDIRRWTFVLGENGTGKTTLLRSIALLLAGSDALPELIGSPADWVRFGPTEPHLGARREYRTRRLARRLFLSPSRSGSLDFRCCGTR